MKNDRADRDRNAAVPEDRLHERPTVAVRAAIAEAVSRELLGATGAEGKEKPQPSNRMLDTGEVDALNRFYGAVIGSTKAARANARANGAPVPGYPPEAQRVGEVLHRLLSVAHSGR